MKANLFPAALLLFGLNCTSQETDHLSPQQVNQIKNEVGVVADSIWSKWHQLDPEAALQYYSASGDWTSVNSLGTRYDFQTYRKLAVDFKNSTTSYKWATTRRDFVSVTKNTVICTWVGKDEAVWKSGDKTACDPHVYTLVFERIADQWKLAYSHDSGVPISQKSAGK